MDDSVRKKQGMVRARAVSSREHDALPLPPGRKPGDTIVRPEKVSAAVVPLSSSRKPRPKATVRKDGAATNVESHIGKQLKAVYDDVLNQPIPDRFLDLLSQLETKPSSKESGDR
jgi:hypothetical protein